MKSTTQRALKWARAQGWRAHVVEVWIGFGGAQRAAPGAALGAPRVGGVRRDFMGFADILALDNKQGVHAIQTFSGGIEKHEQAYRDAPEVMEAIRHWLGCNNRFTLLGWRKVKRAGRPTWVPRVWVAHFPDRLIAGDPVVIQFTEQEVAS